MSCWFEKLEFEQQDENRATENFDFEDTRDDDDATRRNSSMAEKAASLPQPKQLTHLNRRHQRMFYDYLIKRHMKHDIYRAFLIQNGHPPCGTSRYTEELSNVSISVNDDRDSSMQIRVEKPQGQQVHLTARTPPFAKKAKPPVPRMFELCI